MPLPVFAFELIGLACRLNAGDDVLCIRIVGVQLFEALHLLCQGERRLLSLLGLAAACSIQLGCWLRAGLAGFLLACIPFLLELLVYGVSCLSAGVELLQPACRHLSD
jgi:hypothetical protein